MIALALIQCDSVGKHLADMIGRAAIPRVVPRNKADIVSHGIMLCVID